MKIKSALLITVFFFSTLIFPSEHGIYMLTNKSIKSNVDKTTAVIIESLKAKNFRLLKSTPIHVPDYVREDSTEHCGLKAQLIVFTSDEYLSMLTSYGSKYLVAGFLKIGVYETKTGINVSLTDPETINRIVFNDLYENDKEDLYNVVISKTSKIKEKIIGLLHNSVGGEKVKLSMEPIRDDEDLAESSRDMFMMVGPLTLFNDEDQFPIIYSLPNADGLNGLEKLRTEFKNNLKIYKPTEDDKEYRWYKNEDDLKWRVISEVVSPKKDAILLGITRPRTEAVSFNIAGASRDFKLLS